MRSFRVCGDEACSMLGSSDKCLAVDRVLHGRYILYSDVERVVLFDAIGLFSRCTWLCTALLLERVEDRGRDTEFVTQMLN